MKGERSVLDRAEDRWFVDRDLRTATVLLFGGGAFLVTFTVGVMVLPFAFTLALPGLAIAAAFFLAYPRETLVLTLAARIVLDLLWWAPSLGGINVNEAFSGTVFGMAILLTVVNDERIQRHYFFVPTLVFLIPLAVGAIEDVTITGEGVRSSVEYIARVLSPILLMFLVSIQMDTERLRRAMIYAVPLAATVPIATGLYHWMNGQTTVYIFQGYGRLLGGYQNLHHHAHAMALYLSVGIFLLAVETRPWRRGLAAVYTAFCTWELYLTYVRTTQLGVVFLLAVFLAARRKFRWLVGGALVAIPVLANSTVFQERYGELVNIAADGPTYGTDVDQIGSGRVGLWREGFEEYIQRPPLQLVFGKGSRGAHRTHLVRDAVDTHNDYLNITMTSGVVGLAIYLYFQATLAWICLSIRRRSTEEWWRVFADFMLALNAMVLLTNTMSNSYISRFTFGMVFWMLAGVVIAKHREIHGSLELPPWTEGRPKGAPHGGPGEPLQYPIHRLDRHR